MFLQEARWADDSATDPPLCSIGIVDLESYLEVERFEKKAQEEDQPPCLRREVICPQTAMISIKVSLWPETFSPLVYTSCSPSPLTLHAEHWD